MIFGLVAELEGAVGEVEGVAPMQWPPTRRGKAQEVPFGGGGVEDVMG